MSLEAIAALLGHRSMKMTLTYARISDRTVAVTVAPATTGWPRRTLSPSPTIDTYPPSGMMPTL